jgi:hypothetical protein
MKNEKRRSRGTDLRRGDKGSVRTKRVIKRPNKFSSILLGLLLLIIDWGEWRLRLRADSGQGDKGTGRQGECANEASNKAT